MARILTLPAGRRAKFVVAAVFFLVTAIVSGLFSGKFEDAQKNETVSFLPGKAESVKSLEAVKRYPGGELAPAVVVYERKGGLNAADRSRVAKDQQSFARDRPSIALPPQKPVFSRNGDAALFSIPIRVTGDANRFETGMDSIRARVSGEHGGLTTKVTGGAGYQLDAVKVFGNINGTLLGVTALIVLILLVIIYRSPIFWAIPFFTVLLAESTARGIGYLLAEAGVTINGQSGGILPVLVFGAGTDYALLLVSRYREELRRHEDKHDAIRVALQTAGPAILASGLTVIVALLTLSLAEVNGTAGLGPIGAMGVGLAMISMLTMLPALLAIFGRKAFWSPFFDTIPHVGQQGTDETHGRWRAIGEWVAARSRRVWVGGTLVLVVLALNVTQIDTGLTNTNSFRGEVESVQGADILARSFPGGLGGLTNVIVPDRGKADAVRAALEKRRELVAQVLPAQQGPPGTRLDVVLRRDPFATATFDQVPALRRAVKAAGGASVLVGGPTAEAYDYRKSATRDNFVVLPLALLVVFVILAILLRSLLAPLLLVLSVILSFFAALGTGIFFFEHVFGFQGVDPSLPLLTFVFLVALGIDYNIFLMARVREETLTHGTRQGMLRGLAVTGGVITSAGIVLAGTFSALAVLPLVFLTEIGFIIAFGVLLDTFLVRSVLVPALAFDLGPRIWWPSRLQHEEERVSVEA
jgi:putative drug exporter of the RND superfamily